MHVPAWPVLPDQTLAEPVSEAFRVPALAGLGVTTCDVFGCYDDGTGAGGSPAGTPTPPATTGIDWGSILGTAIKSGTDLSKLVLIQPGTVQQGSTILRQTPGFAVPTPTTQTGVTANVSAGAGLAVAAAVGLAALVFLMGRR